MSSLQRMIHDWKHLVVLSLPCSVLYIFIFFLVYFATVFDVFYYNPQVYQNMKKEYYHANVGACGVGHTVKEFILIQLTWFQGQ